jgi:hypothetical protein
MSISMTGAIEFSAVYAVLPSNAILWLGAQWIGDGPKSGHAHSYLSQSAFASRLELSISTPTVKIESWHFSELLACRSPEKKIQFDHHKYYIALFNSVTIFPHSESHREYLFLLTTSLLTRFIIITILSTTNAGLTHLASTPDLFSSSSAPSLPSQRPAFLLYLSSFQLHQVPSP